MLDLVLARDLWFVLFKLASVICIWCSLRPADNYCDPWKYASTPGYHTASRYSDTQVGKLQANQGGRDQSRTYWRREDSLEEGDYVIMDGP